MRSPNLRITLGLVGLAVALSGCDSGDEDAMPVVSGSSSAADSAPSRSAAADRVPNDSSVPDDWDTFTDPTSRISFRYPAGLGTTYIQPLDWPPLARIEAGPFECTEAGEETARAGRTELATIDGRTYCVTRVTEGAAGSVYTMHAYALPAGDEVVFLTFSTRAPQCGNYDEPRRSECERERETLSIDRIVDAIARTLEIPE